MKVFTVGLDQKPPIKDGSSDTPAPEKTNGGSPPPGYVPTQNVKHIPLPMGPEIPQPPHPIVMRKSRGYKGILLVMLSVFLMALFALTLSEIAYNRQRDENFFRLKWAELKHRLGYGDNAYDYYHRANAALNPDRYFSLSKNKEMAEALIQQSSEASTSTSSPGSSSTPEPVVAIDSFPPKPSSFEQQQQQQQTGEGMIRDARLQFLKTILQKIKQHAEDMGFDGTMQVSVIEVEPQTDGTDQQFSLFGGQGQQHPILKGQSFHPLLPNFFPHLPIEDSSSNQQAPKSDSFMDGFGEYHQPTFMQNNQVVEQNRANRLSGPFSGGWPREEDNSNQQPQQPHNGEFGDVIGMQWPRANSNPFHPDSFFHPMNNWQMLPQQQQQFPQPPHILPRPPSFDRWSGGNGAAPQEGEDTPRDNPQRPPNQPMIQVFPQQPAMPMLPPMVGPNSQQQHQQSEQLEQTGKSNEHFSPESSSSGNASPSQEVVGEMYGRKFGRMLQDIIANRIQGFQNMQQLNPLMLPPSALLGPQQPDLRPRLPFPEPSNGNNFGGNGGPPPPMGPSPFFPPPPPPNQQMAMPQQWWQPPANNPPQQQQIHPSNLLEENQGSKMSEKSGLPPPPPVIFFPMGQGQALNGQPQPFPAFAKEMMGGPGQKKDFGGQQQQQFPVFKNFIPPEDRIQVEPPQQNFPSQPEGPQRAGSNNEEAVVKTLVDNNMNGGAPRGWTHQFPKPSSSQQQAQEQPDSGDSNSHEESVTSAQTPEEIAPAAADQESKSSSSTSNEQQPSQSKDSEGGDVWLVAPPHRTQTPHLVDASTDDTSAATPSSSAARPPAFSPPKDHNSMTTHRLSTASFIEPDQALSFTSFAHISKQLPIKLSFTKNHHKTLAPPTLPPKLNLSSQNLIYHPLIAVEDNYSELVESNSQLEPLPSQVYRTDSEASIVSGSSDHLEESEDKGLANFGEIPSNVNKTFKEAIKIDAKVSNFGIEREKNVENKLGLASQVKEPDFLAEIEKKDVDDYDLPDTSLGIAGGRLSILPLNGSESTEFSSLNMSNLPEDQLTLRVGPQLVAATERFEDQNLDFQSPKSGEINIPAIKVGNFEGEKQMFDAKKEGKLEDNTKKIGGFEEAKSKVGKFQEKKGVFDTKKEGKLADNSEKMENIEENKSKLGNSDDGKARKQAEKVEKLEEKTMKLFPAQSFVTVTPAGLETTNRSLGNKSVLEEKTTTLAGIQVEDMRKRGEHNMLVSGNTQLDEPNIPAYPEKKSLKMAASVDPSMIDKEDGSELEEEEHHVFGEQGLHTVDFPAVKFPMMGGNNDAAVKPVGGNAPSDGDALSSPQNDQQGQQAVHSNPVFFQVDDPSSVEQPARAVVA